MRDFVFIEPLKSLQMRGYRQAVLVGGRGHRVEEAIAACPAVTM